MEDLRKIELEITIMDFVAGSHLPDIPQECYQLISPNKMQRCNQCLVSSLTLTAVCSFGINLVLPHSPHYIVV